jgi:hypothetical protein
MANVANVSIGDSITAQVDVPHFAVSMLVLIAIVVAAVWLSLPRRK